MHIQKFNLMTKLFISIFLLCILRVGIANDTTKVLFIGNSFTSYNNLPSLFYQTAWSANKPVKVLSHMPGGVSVGDIAQGTSAHMNNPTVYQLIRAEDWDYLVLQDNQGRFCLSYGQFPPSSLVIEGHKKIRDSLLYYHPCAKVLWFTGFGPKDGYMPYGNSGIALIDSIYQNYEYMMDSLGQIIAPIGAAFKRVITNYPSINLWSADDTHPSLAGSMLSSHIIYSTIFKSTPLQSNFNAGLSDAIDSTLKTIAFQTTLDSISETGLQLITPSIVQSNNNLTINGFQTYQWFLDGADLNLNQNNILINQSGKYYAKVWDTMNCEFLTLEQYFHLSTNYLDEMDKKGFQIYPNPAQQYITVNTSEMEMKQAYYSILNSTGLLIKSRQNVNLSDPIYVGDLTNGIYIFQILFKNQIYQSKLIINR